MNNSTTLLERLKELQIQLSNCLLSDKNKILDMMTELHEVCEDLEKVVDPGK